MQEILVINGHDYSRFIEAKGIAWERNDIDSDKSGRSTINPEMRRYKLGTKRKMSYNLIGMKREELAQLDDDLSSTFFQATYLDLHGVQTRTFYCSSFKATTNTAEEDGYESWWDGATFTVIEQ